MTQHTPDYAEPFEIRTIDALIALAAAAAVVTIIRWSSRDRR